MTTITAVEEVLPKGNQRVSITGMANGDDSSPVYVPIGLKGFSWQAVGVFGASGGQVNLEISNNGTDWFSIANLSSVGMQVLATQPGGIFIRAHVTAGDGSTDLNVFLRLAGSSC
jgi:hypothetical protein